MRLNISQLAAAGGPPAAARRRERRNGARRCSGQPAPSRRGNERCHALGAGRLRPRHALPRKGGCDEGLLAMKRRASFRRANAFVLARERVRFEMGSARLTRRDGWDTQQRWQGHPTAATRQHVRGGRGCGRSERTTQRGERTGGRAERSGQRKRRDTADGRSEMGSDGAKRAAKGKGKGCEGGRGKACRPGRTKHPHARSGERHGDGTRGKCARRRRCRCDVRTGCARISG